MIAWMYTGGMPANRPLLPRLHLFEFADQPWFPRVLFELGTDYLNVISERMGAFDAATPVLARGLRASETPEVLDLGTGGSGPLPRLSEQCEAQQGLRARVVLSETRPTPRAAERARARGVDYVYQPVNATQVPPELRGMRTIFNALHHFKPEQVKQVLADAQEHNVPFAAFEVVKRTPGSVLSVLPTPLAVWLLTPFISRLSPLLVLLTYVLPVAPLTMFWDGLVSALRAYSLEELRSLTASITRPGYTWEVGEVTAPGKPAVTYVLGLPERPLSP